MICVDWVCGKDGCKIKNNIRNSFHYTLCKQCQEKLKEHACSTCIYGERINHEEYKYFCLRDNTVGII